jgi:hypothetical protein
MYDSQNIRYINFTFVHHNHVQTGPGTQPSSCANGGTGVMSLEQTGQGEALNTHTYLASRLRMNRNAPLCLRGMLLGDLYLYTLISRL